MPLPPKLLAAAAATVALVAPGSAFAIELSSRPDYLPPPDGLANARARLLAAQGQELIVGVKRGERAATVLRAHRARRLSDLHWLVEAGAAQAVVRQLEAIGALRYAHGNGRLLVSRTLASSGDPSDPAPWWIPQIGADRAGAPPGPGYPITIADSGIDATHPEFAARPSTTYLNTQTIAPTDVGEAHGTMVGSVAGAPSNGVGMMGLHPSANLQSLDTGLSCAEVLTSLTTAIDARPSVLNLSWSFRPADCPALYELLIVAFGTGSLPVAAAGNYRELGSPQVIPSILPHVLTVGSTSPQGIVSYFSSRDTGLDLSAPGEQIVAATPTIFNPNGYETVDGTSFSAPLVSAAASWVATQRRIRNMTQLFDLIRWSARDVGPAGWDPDTGFGILDLPNALTRSLPAVDPQEPNDDVNQVKAGRGGGLFRDATPPLTRRGRGRAVVRARLDSTEDPVDVYRVFVPGRRVVRFRLAPNSDVDLELFRPNARSCYYRNRRQALRGALIGGSYRAGNRVETFAVENSSRSGGYAFACVFKPSSASILTASYSLSIRTTRR